MVPVQQKAQEPKLELYIIQGFSAAAAGTESLVSSSHKLGTGEDKLLDSLHVW